MIPESLRPMLGIFASLLASLVLARLLAKLVSRRLTRPSPARRMAAATATWLDGKAIAIAVIVTPPIEALMTRDLRAIVIYVIIVLSILACLLLDFLRRYTGK